MEDFVVSARKYRPDTFDTVVGQEAITTTLKNSIKNGHLAQSFLFCGPRGVGKTTCARILARTINCTNLGPDMEPCGQCESCRGFLNNASQNIYELDAASNRNVEAMRALVEQVRIPPQVGKYKVYIIDEVHMLTSEAFNAFLKTLEEPPAYAKFILATTEKNKIIPTILSRCQIFDFKRIKVEDMVNHLKKICEKEGIQYEEEALRIVAQKADGGLRDALSMFDQIVSFSGNSITYKRTIDMLNILDYETYFEMFGNFMKSDVSGCLNLFNQVLENGFDGQAFVNGLNGHLRTLMLMKEPQTVALVESSPALQERYRQQSAAVSLGQILQGLEYCNQCDLQYRNSNNKRLLVEILLLQMVRIFNASALTGGEARSASVGELERADDLPAQPAPAPSGPRAAPKPDAQVAPKPAPPVEVSPAPSAAPSATPRPTSIPTPAPTSAPAPPSAEATPTTPTPPSAPAPQVPLRSAISLQGLSGQLKKAEEKTEQPLQKAPDKDFTQEELNTAWQAYLETVQEGKAGFHSILSRANPTLADGFAIALTVPNRYVADELTQGQKEVLDFLRKELQNYSIRFDVKIDESLKPEKPIYTPLEKFQAMVERNPELQNFRTTLNLDIEL